MKSGCKTLAKRVSALMLTAVMAAQTAFVALPQTAYASDNIEIAATEETSNARIEAVCTDYLPQVISYTDPLSGFTHPGVGVTGEILENLQTQLRAGSEPWKSYFEAMLLDTDFSSKDLGPKRNGGGFNNSQFANANDGARAYAQAVMYFVTGDNAYRRNAMKIIRAYEDIDPESLAYFNDACIHTGIPTNRICIAAEILRYSTYEVTEGYTDAELAWTDEDTEKFISNFLSPEVEVFQYSPDRFMNQHLYTNIGVMSAALFMDDREGYEKAVEWFTVNRNARDQGQNGAIKRLFREITTVDKVGEKEGSGTPLKTPVIQHVEMGRDQAHGCGDLTNSAIMSRMMQAQGTKVDPDTGTVSTGFNAVDCFTYLDDRLINTSDFFFEYMLGYNADWVSVPFAIDTDGTIKDSYAAFAASYRGRYLTINFWDFYTYYRYDRKMTPEQIKEKYPFFYAGYQQKTYAGWGNNDGGGDFWIFLPAEAAGDTSFIPNASEANVIQVENRGNVVSDQQYGAVQTEVGSTFIHVTPSADGTRIAMNSAGIGSSAFTFRVRTDGVARLTMSGGPDGTIYLPNTGGQWADVVYNKTDSEGLGDMYFFTVSELTGTYVDVDAIYTAPETTIAFQSGREAYSLTTYAGAPFQMQFDAAAAPEGTSITYSLVNAPDGAAVDTSGTVTWTPTAGTYTFYVQGKSGDTVALKQINMTVSADRSGAVQTAASAVDTSAVYTTASKKVYDQALAEINAALDNTGLSDGDFAALLNKLNDAIAQLELVSPPLLNDALTAVDIEAGSPSLDFRNMNLGNRSTFGRGDTAAWLDAEPGTFVGFWLVEDKGSIMDFGPDYKITVNKFGFQARAGFSDRLAGMQVYGSNDRVSWTKLTVAEAAYQQGYQTVDVETQYHNTQFRYLRFKKTTEYPDVLSNSVQNLNEFGELRIWGTRYETGNLIESVTMSSDQLSSGRIKMGDTVKVQVQGRDTIQGLKVNINGIEATIATGMDNLYTASAVMTSDKCKTGAVSVQVDYKKADGTDGETFYGTTDGTSLFLVNSDTFIDTGTLATEIVASHKQWGGQVDEHNIAKTLFDGDVTTFGDLEEQTAGLGHYFVDFGEGVSVTLSEVMLMPRSTEAGHASRLNGTVIYGSNDIEHAAYADKTWTPLTPAVTGATMNVWTHIPESAMMNKGAYRFYKISGGQGGNIAEVEFYGTYGADVSMVAGQITSMPEQSAFQSKVAYPAIPAGFTAAIKTSSNENVIGTDGTLCPQTEDTQVTVTLEISSGAESEVTKSITVTVKGLNSVVTGLSAPTKGASSLALPDIPDGTALSVTSSSEESVVATGSGKITTPAQDTLVTVNLKLTRSSDNASVDFGPYTILIYGTAPSGKLDVKSLAVSLEPNQYTSLIFDGKEDTFSDMNSGNTHTIDFGNGVQVTPVKFRIYPRSDSNDNNAQRTNGAVIKGSDDGSTWTDITKPVSGIRKGQWYEIEATEFVNYGSFRYFQITGATRGSMAEVEFYGIKTGEATEEPIPPETPEEPPEGAVDVATVAAEIVACAKEWANPAGSGRDEHAVAALLFDSDLDTFGDLASGNTYTIDFGENKAITPTDFWVYPRKGTGNKPIYEYVERLNGVKVQGSNNQTEWVDLTNELTGITKSEEAVKWYNLSITGNKMTAFRYIRITGGTGGNIAEVKMYGEVKTVTPAEPDAPEELTNVNGIATVTANGQQYGNTGMAATDIGKMLFDGDLNNFGDLTGGTGDWKYTIDFGESTTVAPVKFAVYPRVHDGSNNKPTYEHVQRLNGVKFQGSVNGTDWVDLTGELTGIAKEEASLKWHELTTVIEDMAIGYRYLRITGGTGGNIAEVKIFVKPDSNS